MSTFVVPMSSPFRSGYTDGKGGPNSGGHHSPDWFIRFGMDLGAEPKTLVRAAFAGHITRLNPHDPAADTAKVFGAQIFIRYQAGPAQPSFGNDKMGGFYTHVTDVPASLAAGSWVDRGDILGTVMPRGASSHLHLALVEIIGGAPGGRYVGIDLYDHFKRISNSESVLSVTFQQSGAAPAVA